MKIYFSSKNKAAIVVADEEDVHQKRLKLILEELRLMAYPFPFQGENINYKVVRIWLIDFVHYTQFSWNMSFVK